MDAVLCEKLNSFTFLYIFLPSDFSKLALIQSLFSSFVLGNQKPVIAWILLCKIEAIEFRIGKKYKSIIIHIVGPQEIVSIAHSKYVEFAESPSIAQPNS